jgi:hypothetical protein
MVCRHCGHPRVNRPRGLCWSCYYKPGLRDLYPSTSKFSVRGPGDFNGRVALPAVPTSAAPGSAEKIAVMQERVRKRQSLWHPLDARLNRDGGATLAAALEAAEPAPSLGA